ncbi:hypothetical protein J2T08_002999 [Neorhizobium galegae]|uniref:hypothetical protein n=1 Tax=Neorhizobium galegae TaxID=399 RepID=UPI0027867B98|nr:hypothetical protein [Neorhizobium galegae]MDQ0135078.1 hypothetical protein [Neorhizobium galegae]
MTDGKGKQYRQARANFLARKRLLLGSIISSVAGGTLEKSIAVVGNGIVSLRDCRLIDSHDLVVRFNKAKFCGVYGRRTDVLVVADIARIGNRRFNLVALAGAKEVWTVEAPRQDVWTSAGMTLAERKLVGRPRRILDVERAKAALEPFEPASGTYPSSGVLAIQHLLDWYPGAKIELFGFSHQGNDCHDWNAERRWCESLRKAGMITRYNRSDDAMGRLVQSVRTSMIRFVLHFGEHFSHGKLARLWLSFS